jgi:hypothetical protein
MDLIPAASLNGMAVGEVTEYSDSYELVQDEAENLLESYRNGEPYTNTVDTELEPDELEREITEAVDELDIENSYSTHEKLLMKSGGIASSGGALALLAGEPLGIAPLAVGGGHFLAARHRKNTPKIKEIETKALLQDALYRNLEVNRENGENRIEFDYRE